MGCKSKCHCQKEKEISLCCCNKKVHQAYCDGYEKGRCEGFEKGRCCCRNHNRCGCGLFWGFGLFGRGFFY